jgi:hypothetical protein
MAAKNSSYYQSGPCQEVKQKEHLFHLFMDQHVEGTPGANQKAILNPRFFGLTAVVDWTVRDGPAPEANIVARAKGTAIQANMSAETWLMCYTLLFSDERLVICFLYIVLCILCVSDSYLLALNLKQNYVFF